MIGLSSNSCFCGGFLWEDINKLNINYQKKDVILESKLSHVNLTIPHLTREFPSIFIMVLLMFLLFRNRNNSKFGFSVLIVNMVSIN